MGDGPRGQCAGASRAQYIETVQWFGEEVIAKMRVEKS